MRDADLDAWIEENKPNRLPDLALILSEKDQAAILAAAYAAHRGDDFEAEKFRQEAGYGGLH
jgi:hypothetical protein